MISGNSTVQTYQYGPCTIPAYGANGNKQGYVQIIGFSNSGAVVVDQLYYNVSSNLPSLVVTNFACQPFNVPIGQSLACNFDVSGPSSMFPYGINSFSPNIYIAVNQYNKENIDYLYSIGGGLVSNNATFYSFAYAFTIPSGQGFVPCLGSAYIDIYISNYGTYQDFSLKSAFNVTAA